MNYLLDTNRLVCETLFMESAMSETMGVELLQARGKFILKYCLEREWNPESLDIKQILEIRAQDGWKNPVRPATLTQETKP